MTGRRNDALAAGKNSGEKKPYVKPCCVSEPIYETLALACGKLPGQGAVCHAAPRRS
ncbi:MAG: hypothetical protein ACRD5M_13810 [Candidatus Acidiferrales bacterium]